MNFRSDNFFWKKTPYQVVTFDKVLSHCETACKIQAELCSLHDMALLLKGQLISECLFDFFKFSKKPTKNLTNFCPSTKKWSNQQSEGFFL